MSTQQARTESVYIGPERRSERRRRGNPAFEKLLLEFGLDRRLESDQRESNSSWLLLSEASQIA
ncbi:MAG TPA: hypothetical protein ENJ60_10870 [Aeromonadales bacterium]|nr:hypothetical protein [Aeromonadales bacterium]